MTSRCRRTSSLLSLSFILATSFGCTPGECLRVSDCDNGLTCVGGTCIDAGVDARVDTGVDAKPDGTRDARADRRGDGGDASERADRAVSDSKARGEASHAGEARDGSAADADHSDVRRDGPETGSTDAHARDGADAHNGDGKAADTGGKAPDTGAHAG